MNNILDLRDQKNTPDLKEAPVIGQTPAPLEPPLIRRAFNFCWEIIKIVVVSLAIIIPVRVYVVQPFIVEGASMSPSFEDGQYLIVDEISYRFNPPRRGDVVIFHPPTDEKTYYIKRVIGLPNETIQLKDEHIFVHNQEYPDGFRLNEANYLIQNRITQEGKTTLNNDEYYVIGDNRDNSLDSRRFGPVKAGDIKGKVFLRAFPFNEFNFFERPIYNILQKK